ERTQINETKETRTASDSIRSLSSTTTTAYIAKYGKKFYCGIYATINLVCGGLESRNPPYLTV
ncbi:7021_t:CDS:2, partial [Funneliformis mosseae]